MHPELRDALRGELASARLAEAKRAYAQAWRHLERAHVLSQAHAWPHVRVHVRMFGFAWRCRDLRELVGQLPRILLAAPGSWTGRAPRGNTGGASVGIFTPMVIPADLALLLRKDAVSELALRDPRDWARIGLWLVGATLAYNVVEAVIALWTGAEAESIALFGFGLDSVVECAAAGVLLWRLGLERRGVDPCSLERAERRVHRFVGGTFLALALYVSVQSLGSLWRHALPSASWVGIALAAASLVIMPLVSWGKLRAAREIGSAALRAEAKETLACSYLSFALLLGLVANALAGWWWADPLAALAMVPWLVKEGNEGLRGDACHDDH